MSDGMEWERCPEHGPFCNGRSTCCCRDKHPAWFTEGPALKAQTPASEFYSKPDFEQALDDTLAEVRAVMVDRHKKYGPGNINRHGEYGVVVRLGDKYERLDHSREQDFADEAVDDTALDIIGYGLIFRMLRAGRWPGQEISTI